MKLSLNWVKQFTDIELPLDKLVEKIGGQLGAVENVTDLGKRYKGLLVVRVVAVERHPDATKLTVCKVDDGGVAKKVPRDSQGLVQIVCGAPNVEAGMMAVWIPAGVTVPSTLDKEPLVLEAREIRGIVSNGMLASPSELDFSDDHSGLLRVDEDIAAGAAFANAYKLDDHIIDIENKMFTHRPDLFGMLGLAREIAGISGRPFSSPQWYLTDKFRGAANASPHLPLKVSVDIPKLVPRFSAVSISGVKVGPSPIWLQSYLIRVGVRPVNNIVDLTNFVMWETGQPLHAYDYDKIGGQLDVRRSKAGEELAILGGKTITLQAGEIAISSGGRPVGLGGVMGGAQAEVDETTKNIVIEAASFSMSSVRASAMTHGLFTDAATRFTKNPAMAPIPAIIAKATDDIVRMAGGQLASSLVDLVALPARSNQPITVSRQFINARLGLELTTAAMAKLLGNVEVKVQASDSKLIVTPPAWRTDLAIAEDLVEEVGRLQGYDQIPQQLPGRDLAPAPNNTSLELTEQIRDILSSLGGSEVLTYSFVRDSLLASAGQDKRQAFHVRNALSPDLQYYRLSLLPSLFSKIQPNIKAGYDQLALYEIGRAHVRSVTDKESLPAELPRLGLALAYKNAPGEGAPYFHAKHYLQHLSGELGIGQLTYEPLGKSPRLSSAWHQVVAPLEPGRAALIKHANKILGVVGEPSAVLRQALKLPTFTAGFELDTAALKELVDQTSNYQSLNKYPSLSVDLCLRAPAALSFAEQNDFLQKQLEQAKTKQGYSYRLSPLSIYESPKQTSHHQTTWRINLWHSEQTLASAQVNKLVDELASAAKARLGAVRI